MGPGILPSQREILSMDQTYFESIHACTSLSMQSTEKEDTPQHLEPIGQMRNMLVDSAVPSWHLSKRWS